MQITDPIADMLTRIRNAGQARFKECQVPGSKLKLAVAEILKEEGYIENYTFEEDDKQGVITITLKYRNKRNVISGLKRISKPGLRVYANSDQLPKVLDGLGIAIISTSQGVMTDKTCRSKHIGGEVMAYVW